MIADTLQRSLLPPALPEIPRLEAAAPTALARHSIRALARDDPPPSTALRRLNDAVIAERALEPRFSTVAYAP